MRAHGVGQVGKTDFAFDQAKPELVVLPRERERLVETVQFCEQCGGQSEVSAEKVHVGEAVAVLAEDANERVLPPSPCLAVVAVVVKSRSGLGIADIDAPFTTGGEMGGEEPRQRPDVIVDEDKPITDCCPGAGVASGRRVGTRVLNYSNRHWPPVRVVTNCLSGAVGARISRHDHLEAAIRDVLLCQ